MKKTIFLKLGFWIIILTLLLISGEDTFKVQPNNLFMVIWVGGFLTVLMSLSGEYLPVGATKHKKKFFVPSGSKEKIKTENKGITIIIILWLMFLLGEGVLYYVNILDEKGILLVYVLLRISDIHFILIWCPFGAIMRNRCCNVCRIYGWDQLMLNSTLTFIIFISPIYTAMVTILLSLSLIQFIDWEVAAKRHPERFSDKSNASLRCTHCKEICGRCKVKRPGEYNLF